MESFKIDNQMGLEELILWLSQIVVHSVMSLARFGGLLFCDLFLIIKGDLTGGGGEEILRDSAQLCAALYHRNRISNASVKGS